MSFVDPTAPHISGHASKKTVSAKVDGYQLPPHPLDLATRLEPVFAMIATWQERAKQRRHLASLPDHMLNDIGVSKADAHREASKPFWRA